MAMNLPIDVSTYWPSSLANHMSTSTVREEVTEPEMKNDGENVFFFYVKTSLAELLLKNVLKNRYSPFEK